MGCRWLTEKLKTLWAKLKERLKKISKKVYIIAGAALVVLAAAVVLVLYNRPYAVLVTGVSSGEASSILSYLDSLGVTDYKVENNDTILVPKGQEAALKGRILMAGYPQTGYALSLIHILLVESGQDTEAAAIRVATVRIAEDFLTKGKTAIISVGKS